MTLLKASWGAIVYDILATIPEKNMSLADTLSVNELDVFTASYARAVDHLLDDITIVM